MTGRQRLPLAAASLPVTSTSFPPFVLPAGSKSPGAAPHFPSNRPQAVEPPMGSPGRSRPFSPQSLYPRESQLPLPVFGHGVDQVRKPHNHGPMHSEYVQGGCIHFTHAAPALGLCTDLLLISFPFSRGIDSLCCSSNHSCHICRILCKDAAAAIPSCS